MAETQPMFETNLCYTAGEFRRFTNGLVCTEGVAGPFPHRPLLSSATWSSSFSFYTGSLAVATGTTALDLFVLGGSAYIKGDDATDQGMYWIQNDATVTLTAAAASASDPRIDRVVATVRDTDYGGSDDDWVLQIVTGTPTTGATLTNLTGVAAEPSNSITLAYVLVPALFAGPFVNATHIRDARQPYAMCESGAPRLTLFVGSGTGSVGNTLNFVKADWPWLKAVRVRCIGAGGGGGGGNGGVASGAAKGAGGGGGGMAEAVIDADRLAATEVATAGNGGSAGSNTGGNGGNGGDSTFGSWMTGSGGSGGNGMTPATTGNSGVAGGSGGGGSFGPAVNGFTAQGGHGQGGYVNGGFGNRPNGGSAGGSGAGGGRGGDGAAAAQQGGNPGGGGGGGGSSTGNAGQTGATGADGAVIIELFG